VSRLDELVRICFINKFVILEGKEVKF